MQNRVLNLPALLTEVERLRNTGRRIATTNGCFDVLHLGHLRYLEAARTFGDVLIVLLNDDDSVRALKGPQRPIVPQDDRAELLAGLRCVDYVTLFSGLTPLDSLREIRPDVHIKGEDYCTDTLPEATVLKELSVKMEFVPLVAGRSTTNIIDRIRQASAPAQTFN